MLKLDDNPAALFPDDVLDAVSGNWWVAHTKARMEKAFAWDLFRKQIPYFLPMIERVRISGGKKRRTKLPVFTSYVFFRGDSQQRVAALATNRLCQVVPVPDQAQLTRELRNIRRVIDEKQTIDFFPVAAVGRRCRITSGPLEGMEGTVIRRDGVTRMVLQVSILGQGAAVEIEPDLLEEVDS